MPFRENVDRLIESLQAGAQKELHCFGPSYFVLFERTIEISFCFSFTIKTFSWPLLITCEWICPVRWQPVGCWRTAVWRDWCEMWCTETRKSVMEDADLGRNVMLVSEELISEAVLPQASPMECHWPSQLRNGEVETWAPLNFLAVWCTIWNHIVILWFSGKWICR